MDKNMLNEVYSELYDVIGEDAMLGVYNLFRGQQITFPMRLYAPKLLRNAIIQEYNGSNISYLACKYGYSERSIRRILKYENVKSQENKTQINNKIIKRKQASRRECLLTFFI